jgi:polyphosphate glucokinase
MTSTPPSPIDDAERPKRRLRVLVVDIGGSNAKALATGQRTRVRLPTGPGATPLETVMAVREATRDWQYDVVTIGVPGPVVDGMIVSEPHNLGPGWLGFDFEAAFEKPVRVLNDAAMQALGAYSGGRALYLGFGTGLGSALVVEGHVQPLELAHLPYRKKQTFEDYVGERGRLRLGTRKWRRHVIDVIERLSAALQVQSILLGGGNARRLRDHLDRLPLSFRLGDNVDAFRGGFRLWMAPEERTREVSNEDLVAAVDP